MTISATTSRIQYTASGGDTFAYPFRIVDEDDLTVILTDTSEVETVQTLNSDYTVTGVGDASGTVVFTSPPTATDLVTIFINPDAVQPIDYTANGPFPAESHETGLDRVTLVAARAIDLAGRALTLTDGSNESDATYDAADQRIINLGTPQDTTDAVTKDYADALAGGVAGAVIATGSTENRTLQDRWGDFVNVKDFGATGNGVTDDTTEFQAAIDSLSGNEGTIFIPDGDYVVDLYSLTYGTQCIRWVFDDRATTTNIDAPQVYVFPSGATFGSEQGLRIDPDTGDHVDVYRVFGENESTSGGSVFAFHFDLTGHTDGEAVRGLLGRVTNASDGDGETKAVRVGATDLNTTTGAQALATISADVTPSAATQSARIIEAVLAGTADDVAYAAYFASDSARWKGGIVFDQGDEYEDAVIQASMSAASASGSRFLKLKDHPAAAIIFEVTWDGKVRGAEVHGGADLTNSVKVDASSISRTAATGDLTISSGASSGTFALQASGATRLLIDAAGPVVPAGLALRMGGTGSGPGIFSGTGDPDGVVAAPVGSIFMRSDGTTNQTLYVKETGTTTSSGWVGK